MFNWKQFARHPFSLIGGIRLGPQTSKMSESTASRTMDNYRNSPTTKLCTDLFPFRRGSSTKFKKGLECVSVN